MTTVSDPLFSPADEQQTDAFCQRCKKRQVFMAAFTWDGERHLQWHCRSCSFVWATPERRVTDRRTVPAPRSGSRRGGDRRALPRRDEHD